MLQILQRFRTRSGAAYMEQGQGDKPIVLIHGVGMQIEAWVPQIAFLSEQHRVIAVDLPGHGSSEPLGKPPELRHFVDWFGTFVDEIGLGSISLVGHSMGALIATGVVATMPDRLDRVALFNGVHRRMATARAAVEGRADEIISGVFDRQAPLSRWFSDEETGGEAFGLVKELLQRVDAMGYATAYKAFATGDGVYSDVWANVSVPALFLTGEKDPNSTPAMALEMAKAAPLGEAFVVAGHRHMVNLTAPSEVNQALTRWLLRTTDAK